MGSSTEQLVRRAEELSREADADREFVAARWDALEASARERERYLNEIGMANKAFQRRRRLRLGVLMSLVGVINVVGAFVTPSVTAAVVAVVTCIGALAGLVVGVRGGEDAYSSALAYARADSRARDDLAYDRRR